MNPANQQIPERKPFDRKHERLELHPVFRDAIRFGLSHCLMKDRLMNRVLPTFRLMLLLSIAGLQPLFGKAAPTSESQLLQELNAGLKAKDKDAILALFNWDGVAP